MIVSGTAGGSVVQRYVAGMTVRSTAILVLLWGLLLSGPAAAQDDKAIEACHDKQSTSDIVDCLDRLTMTWDKRLNAAYQVAIKRADPEALVPLRASERAWLEYRKQRCYYVGAVQGTIARILGADCFMRMTKARAEELAADAKGLGD